MKQLKIAINFKVNGKIRGYVQRLFKMNTNIDYNIFYFADYVYFPIFAAEFNEI